MRSVRRWFPLPPIVVRTLTLAALGVAASGLAAPRAARAQEVAPVERASVLAAVQGVLDAIAHRDTSAARQWMQPGAVLFALPPTAGGPVRRQSDSSFVAFLGASTDHFLERIWTPQVMVRGGLAEVWAPYDFHVNGRRSHCGIDSFTLVRGPAGWRVAAIAYTVETTGCVDSPLGPPPA